MSTLEQIEAAILTLPSDELRRLRQWFADMDYQRWDEQLERAGIIRSPLQRGFADSPQRRSLSFRLRGVADQLSNSVKLTDRVGILRI
jgi:hypothetical protein